MLNKLRQDSGAGRSEGSRNISLQPYPPPQGSLPFPWVFTASSNREDTEHDSKCHHIPHKAAGISGAVLHDNYSGREAPFCPQRRSALVTLVSSWSRIATMS